MFAHLTNAQANGVACVICSDENAPMVPAGHGKPGQLFACEVHGDGETKRTTVLVVGACSTPVEVDDLTARAFDVTDQLGVTTVVATSTNHMVTDFAGVVVVGPSLTARTSQHMDTVACVLEAEAISHSLPIITPRKASENAACDACRQWQDVAPDRNEHGEVLCVDCLGEAPGCVRCFGDEVTEPVRTEAGWEPMCQPCASIGKMLRSSDWNMCHGESAPLPVGVIA